MLKTAATSTLMLLAIAAWGQARPDVPVTSPAQSRVVPLDTTVNGEPGGTWAFIEEQGMLYAPREALDEWRVKVRPTARAITLRGVEYWPLGAVPGFSAKTRTASQAVDITFAPEVFDSTMVSSDRQADRPPVSPVLPSMFVNYDLNYAATRSRSGGSSSDLGAIVEIGGSTESGAFTSTYAGRNLTGSSGDRASWTRLETGFTRSMPDKNLMVRLGDSGTRPGLWGRTVYFGGIQVGTNYALTPGFLTYPIPVIGGVSSSPSTVELYVNDVLRQVSKVPTGPFAIDNSLTALTGSGETRVVVRDILGREMVTTQPFFVSGSLLAKGIADWGAETGALRQDYGLANSHYGPLFASGTWRYGLTDSMTVEARAEATRATQATGLGIIAALPGSAVGRAVLVASRDERAGTGFQWSTGVEKKWRTTTVAAQAEGSSEQFRTMAQGAASKPPRIQLGANVTHATASMGSFGFSFVAVQPWISSKITTLSANYSFQLGSKGSISANVSKALGAVSGTSFGLMLNIPFDTYLQTSAVVNSRDGRIDAYATASQRAGTNNELSWRVLGGRYGPDAHAEAGLYYQGRYGNVFADLSAYPDSVAMRTGLSGGIVFAASNVFVTQRVDQSFAVVEAKDIADVGVGIGTNYRARTDSRGMALVPQLAAYVGNQIRLNPQDIPNNAEIASIEQVVVPPLRSAIRVTFPVRSGRSAIVKIQLDDGAPAPGGALVRVVGDKEEFWVARRGDVYVTGLQAINKLELTWKEQRCQMEVSLPAATKDDIARIGPLTCTGVKR